MTEEFDYPHDDVMCRGRIALPAGDDRRPGVAVFADIGGIGEHCIERAERLAAELGYVALAADFYGEGAVPKDFAEGMPWLQKWRADPVAIAARAGAALEALRSHPRCNGQLGAIGFCFGGSVVLETARADYPGFLAGVSFHGDVATPAPLNAGPLSAKLLVCHGAEDPLVPDASLIAFLREMAVAKADCQTIAYTGVVHSFTNKNADGSVMAFAKYDAATDRRSWAAMIAHFAEVFGS